ncbi:sigma-54 dependent transcriptional regulator [Bartonella sp. HY038]|uniref:sigma-54-dependent transcriptional regulator n=1 Tax=Bartonella sp. HY038 TaxID=2759660 RepID=UPI0015FD7AFC|nr:response regulator [Bartonella sp. HY038]
MVSTILVAMEDLGRRQRISKLLINQGYRIIEASSGYHTLDLLRRRPNIILALLDLQMSDINGLDFIDTLRTAGIRSPIIIVSYKDESRDLARAIESGANDFIIDPFSDIRLMVTIKNTMQRAAIEREIKSMHRCFEGNLHFSDLVVNSLAMQTTVMVAKDIVEHEHNVIITGEQGTGRNSIATIIHRESGYESATLRNIQCRYSLNHEEYAEDWKRNVERALDNFSNGTLLFLNIESLTQKAQDFLYDRLIKLGVENNHHIRLIATTTPEINEILAEGQFHKKLYKLFAQRQLSIPPLRNRREDITDIAKNLLIHIITETGYSHVSGLSNSAINFLSQYDWPDNILELDRILFRAVLLSSGPLLSIADFPQLVKGEVSEPESKEQTKGSGSDDFFFDKTGHICSLDALERMVIKTAMTRYQGRISEVARRLKIGRSTLYRKLVELEIDTENSYM